jgi:ribosomal protein S16
MLGLIAKGQYKAAYELIVKNNTKHVDMKQIIKPVYYALMNFMKDEFPKEYLKAGEELTDTVKEVIQRIEKYRSLFKSQLVMKKQ